MFEPDDLFGRAGRSRGVPNSQLRVSDAERDEVAQALSKHYADGRLDAAELKERLDRAWAARTRADLAGLLVDLPATAAPVPQAQPPVRPHLHRPRLSLFLLVALVFLAASSLAYHGGFLLFVIVAFVFWGRHRTFHYRQSHSRHPGWSYRRIGQGDQGDWW